VGGLVNQNERMANVDDAVPHPSSLTIFAVLAWPAPLSSEYGTYKTVEARFWPWLSGKNPVNHQPSPSSLGTAPTTGGCVAVS
jgi:hypothetical protein